MPTRLFFQNQTPPAGTYPSVKQSARTQSWQTSGAFTIRRMRTEMDTGGQVGFGGVSLANTLLQNGLMRIYVSPPLARDQTIGGTGITMALSIAEQGSATQAQFHINQLCVYIWRPGNGTRIGFIYDTASPASLGGTLSNSSNIVTTNITGIATSAVNALTGDVIACEVWSCFTQSMGTIYSCTDYFGGKLVTLTENTVVANHASFLQFSNNIDFKNMSVRKDSFNAFFN